MNSTRHSRLSFVSAEPQGDNALGRTLDRLFPPRRRAQPLAPQPMERRVNVPAGSRAAALQPSSWNEAERTIDVVWTTGARGIRFNFDEGIVDEELATEPKNVRLDRLNAGAPVLDSHRVVGLSQQIGTVVPGSARMSGGEGIATLKLSDRPEVASIVNDIATGIIRNLSVGYTVHLFEADRLAKPRPLYRAVDWEPMEISFVTVPFDAGAQVRSAPEKPDNTCVIRTLTSKEPKPMFSEWLENYTRSWSGNRGGTPNVAFSPFQSAPQEAAPAGAGGGGQSEAPSYERTASIGWLRGYMQMAERSYGLQPDMSSELALEIAERGLSEGDARDAVMHILAQRQNTQTGPVRGTPVLHGTGFRAGNALAFGERSFDNPHFHASAIGDALFARMSGTAPSEQAREFMGMSMVQIAGDMLSRTGMGNPNRMTPNDVLNAAAWNSGGTRSYMHGHREFGASGAAHTTSDFPELLLGAGERFLLQVFEIAASPLKQISRQRSASDFRTINGLELSGFGTLNEVLEAGEIKHGKFTERKETYRLKTFAKQFGLSRQAIINDDLNAFADPMRIMARAAAETEAQLLADLINSNPVMSDGIPLFDVRHGNLADAGGEPSIEALDAGRQAMRRQKGLDGTPIAPAPQFIVSGIENETKIEKLMTALTTGTADTANPFAGKLTPAVDVRLAAKAWYMFGNPQIAPTLEHAYLDGQTGPHLEQKEGWDTLGTQFRVYMDFGAGAVDWRGAYKNGGPAA